MHSKSFGPGDGSRKYNFGESLEILLAVESQTCISNQNSNENPHMPLDF